MGQQDEVSHAMFIYKQQGQDTSLNEQVLMAPDILII